MLKFTLAAAATLCATTISANTLDRVSATCQEMNVDAALCAEAVPIAVPRFEQRIGYYSMSACVAANGTCEALKGTELYAGDPRAFLVQALFGSPSDHAETFAGRAQLVAAKADGHVVPHGGVNPDYQDGGTFGARRSTIQTRPTRVSEPRDKDIAGLIGAYRSQIQGR